MLPNFLVIGAQKAGTTALYLYLREHPDIFMPEMKELNFFVAAENWPRGLAWYESVFAGHRGEKAVGEASPHYTMHPMYEGVPGRIASVRPDMKLIYLVRDPIERIRSHYQHRRYLGFEMPPIDDAVLTDPEFISRSSYALQIDRYLDTFPLSQMRIVKSEDLRDDRATVLRSLFGFLEVDPDFSSQEHRHEHHVTDTKRRLRSTTVWLRGLPGYERVARALPRPVKDLVHQRTTLLKHRPPEPVSISPAVRAQLEDRLRHDVTRLRSYMGPEFDGWGIA